MVRSDLISVEKVRSGPKLTRHVEVSMNLNLIASQSFIEMNQMEATSMHMCITLYLEIKCSPNLSIFAGRSTGSARTSMDKLTVGATKQVRNPVISGNIVLQTIPVHE